MWDVRNNDLTMTEGDFGIILPVTINGATLETDDSIRLTIKDTQNGEAIVTKEFSNIVDNTFDFEISETETALLKVGVYVYSLDWFQNGNFMCNIIPCAKFKVVDKA